MAAIIEAEIYLIRHGESKGNVRSAQDEALTVCDREDPELTKTGVLQAQKAGVFLKDVELASVFSSGLKRAVRTATEIIKEQKNPQALEILPYVTEAGISEEYETSFDTIRKINPQAILAQGLKEEDGLICHTSAKDEMGLFQKAETAVSYLRSRFTNGEKIAVISHGAFNTYFIFHLMGFKECPIFDLNFRNTGVTKIVLYKKGTNPYGDIVFDYINDSSHLY